MPALAISWGWSAGGWPAFDFPAPAGCRRNPSGEFMVDLPHQIGPCQLVELGALVAIRCPSDLDGILRRAGATREPGSRHWLLSPARAAKLVPKLRRSTDPLFRRAGLNLDHE
jgi:hypothetical protein